LQEGLSAARRAMAQSPSHHRLCYSLGMPTPKKYQLEKDKTRHMREVRKYRKTCKERLGPVGVRLFREFLNLHGRLPISSTACWAEALAQAFGKKRTALSGKCRDDVSREDLNESRGQFGGWGSALLRRRLEIPPANGLQFLVRVIEVFGDTPKPWQAVLVALYERQHGVVFHDLRRVDIKTPLKDDFIWTLISQAVRRLSTGRWPYIKQADGNLPAVSVVFPTRADGELVHPIFKRATACQADHKVVNWQMQAFRGLRHSSLKARALHFQELDRLLRDKSRKVSTVLRTLRSDKPAIDREKKADGRLVQRPAWLLLYPDIYPSDF